MRRWGVRPGGAVVVAVLAPLVFVLEFTGGVPPALPDLSAYEKIEGSADFANPSLSLSYEFYVNPRFASRYEVIRYRVKGGRSDEQARDYRPSERLQWQAGEKDLRRWECEPQAGVAACRWRELAKGTVEYDRETPVILWLLGIHRSLLERRDDGTLPR